MIQQLQLFESLSRYEGRDMEYKAGRGGLPRDLWETYSAFANTDGGTIVLGVTERRGSPPDIHGVEDPDKLVRDFWNTVNNRGKVSLNLLQNDQVRVDALEGTGRSVIFISVPRADRRQRPVFLGGNPLNGTYRRNHDGDYVCTDQEVRRMFADQQEDTVDSRILAGFTLADLDLDSLNQYRNRWRSLRDHAWLAFDDQEFLEKLGGWGRDRSTGEEGLTVAGLLMFGRMETAQLAGAVPSFHLDYRERFSDDPNVRWTDRVTFDGTWPGNIFQFYQRVYQKLSTGPGIKLPFQLDAQGYRQGETAVHEALQEALVNALIHADYYGQGGVVIDRYMDRIDMSNPGTLLVSLEQISRGAVSECRNKSLQRMFQMLGLGDKAGSGIDKIRSSWKAQHWQSPSLEERTRPDRVNLTLPMVSLLPDTALTELQVRFGDQLGSLSHDQVQAVVVAATEGEVSNRQLQGMLPLHPVAITELLQELVAGGFLVPEGFGRWTRYRLAFAGTSSIGKDPSSQYKDPDSQDKDPDSQGSDSAASDVMLREVASPVRSTRRAAPALVRETILALCAGRYLSLAELAELLNRNAVSLQQNYVAPLLREGMLQLRFPEQPNHPYQAYRDKSPERPPLVS